VNARACLNVCMRPSVVYGCVFARTCVWDTHTHIHLQYDKCKPAHQIFSEQSHMSRVCVPWLIHMRRDSRMRIIHICNMYVHMWTCVPWRHMWECVPWRHMWVCVPWLIHMRRDSRMRSIHICNMYVHMWTCVPWRHMWACVSWRIHMWRNLHTRLIHRCNIYIHIKA